MEQVLAGRKKIIVDAGRGRRHLLLVEDGVEFSPQAAPFVAAPRAAPGEER
jgi:hypothetical protein